MPSEGDWVLWQDRGLEFLWRGLVAYVAGVGLAVLGTMDDQPCTYQIDPGAVVAYYRPPAPPEVPE